MLLKTIKSYYVIFNNHVRLLLIYDTARWLLMNKYYVILSIMMQEISNSEQCSPPGRWGNQHQNQNEGAGG